MKITKSQLKQIIQEELENVINEALPLAALGAVAKGYAAGETADVVGATGVEKAKKLARLSDPETMDKGALIALEKISRLQKRITRLERALKRILP
tara:strand:+ start:636 stop:923 length:288 start_codon:yes stop_codon:yes gene_type:complete